jgi:hypothetical protein
MTDNISSFLDKDFADNDEWTIECFVDELFLSLVKIKEPITNDNGKTLHVRKYYRQARDILKWIPISKPPPDFIISISDLPQRILQEFEKVTDNDMIAYIVTQAVGRIFENMDFEYYHLSIARNLRVRFEK